MSPSFFGRHFFLHAASAASVTILFGWLFEFFWPGAVLPLFPWVLVTVIGAVLIGTACVFFPPAIRRWPWRVLNTLVFVTIIFVLYFLLRGQGLSGLLLGFGFLALGGGCLAALRWNHL